MSSSNFSPLGLSQNLLAALDKLGYECPTPIQEKSIPILLQGQDLLAQAQTGTGKTAAFTLPALSLIDLKLAKPQILIIAPTRELAIQVSEACQSYAKYLDDFHVAPIYGGQEYRVQIRALKRGAHIVVGTPGRVMDHLRRGTLEMNAIKMLVLDEADEMLRMGFIDDVEWILAQIPHQHQTALFSATMPPAIKKITKNYLNSAQHIQIKASQTALEAIEQSYYLLKSQQKIDALTRFLEIEPFDAAIIFVRTKTNSLELNEKLQARGYATAALNGDLKQTLRKQVIDQIKKGTLDIVIATDVAARGIDIDRISHVINYDIPMDAESYVHRIGRTGRAGRTGKALLFVTPREQRLLKDIETATGKKIRHVRPPSLSQMQENRSAQLAQDISVALEQVDEQRAHQTLAIKLQKQLECSALELAAALAYLLQKNTAPLADNELELPEFEQRKKSRKQRGHHHQKSKAGDFKRRQKSKRAKFKNKG